MRWVLILIAIAGIFGAIVARSPGLLGLCLLITFLGGIGAVFAFAQARIEGSARPETLTELDAATFKAALSERTSAAEERTTRPS